MVSSIVSWIVVKILLYQNLIIPLNML
jgi:hypothetical protein